MHKQRKIDLTTGPVTKKLLLFVLPIICSNLLQHLYSAADRVVVGRFAENGTRALAAVGGTGAAIAMMVGLFIGMAVGANIVCANLRGAGKTKELRRCMHTALPLSFLCGLILAAVGCLLAKPILLLMNSPRSVINLSALYMRIYFLGLPVSLVMNFGAAIMRANGDTKRPMLILALSGAVNVVLNLVFVIVFKWGVAGVGISTVLSQCLSAVQVLKILFDPKDEYRLTFRELKLHHHESWNIIKIGVPCGINSMAFSLSNMFVQSSINIFDEDIIAGNVAVDSLTGLIYQVLVGFYSACVSFAGQCYGAQKYKRIDKLALSSIWMGASAVVVIATGCTLFPRQLLGLFNTEPHVIEAGIPKLLICAWGYLLYGISEVLIGCLRGMRKVGPPSMINVLGICGTRILWVTLIFPLNPTTTMLYICYPLSWVISMTGMLIFFLRCRRQMQTARPAEV